MPVILVALIGFFMPLFCAVIIFLLVSRTLYKVGPNQALIIYGAGGTKIIVGGSHMVLRMYQRAEYFSLELMSFEIPLLLEPPLVQEKRRNVIAVALIKVRSDEGSILVAAQQFLSKSMKERERLIRLVLEGHLNGLNNQEERSQLVRLVLEGQLYQIGGEQERALPLRLEVESPLWKILDQQEGKEQAETDLGVMSSRMFKAMTTDLDRMGLELVSFTMKEANKL